jgi:FixJ family two-component response regulator
MTPKEERPIVAVVDDDVSVCHAMKRLLIAHGIRAETFTSGRIFIELIETLPSFQPQCAIVDMDMPGCNGLAVQARLAAFRPDIPVVFLSAVAGHAARDLALAAGAAGFFHKPFDGGLNAFIATICEILNIPPEQ